MWDIEIIQIIQNLFKMKETYHSKYSQIILLLLILATVFSQDPSVVATPNQDYIEPIVANQSNTIPATQIPVQSPPPPTTDNNTQHSQGVHLSNTALHGVQAQAVPMPQAANTQDPHAPKFDMSEQAIAKAKAQAERAQQMADQARRQAEMDRKTREISEDEQLQKIQYDQTLSKTQRKKQQERLMFRKIARNVEDGTRFTEYLFEQGLGSSEFFLRIPATQQVAINLYTYAAQDNTYVRTKNIEEQEPVKIYIYQNNHKIVYEGEFYYQTYIIFEGQASAMYLIRVVNNGRTKLISMNTKKLVEEAHISATLQKHDGQHAERTQNLAIDINKWYQDFRKIRMLDFQDLKAAEGYIEKYYSWEVFQTILAVIFCFVQVKMIQGMLKGNTIV